MIEGRIGGPLEFKSTVWKAGKPQLKRETGGKCAYCESPTDTVAHGDVEHFRPKSKYWWRTATTTTFTRARSAIRFTRAMSFQSPPRRAPGLVMKDSLKAFETAGIEPALQQRICDQIRAMTMVDAPYAGMVRYFVKEFQLNV